MLWLTFLLLFGPHRIVSTAPSITEILFALGAGDQVVGDTTYCNYPEAARTKVKIGGFTTPNLELILALNPNLIFMTKDRPDIAEHLRHSRAEIIQVAPDSLAGIDESIRTIARTIGVEERGEALIQAIHKEVHEGGKSKTSPTRKPRVLFVVGRTPGGLTDLVVAGPGNYLSELIDLAGGINVAADAAVMYPRFSFEEVIYRDPDIIIDMGHNEMITDKQKQQVRQLWQKYPFLRAVKHGRVFPISAEYFVTPGPRIGQAVRDLRTILRK